MSWTKPGTTSNRSREPRLDALMRMFDFKDKKFYHLRAIGPNLRAAEHWFATRKKDGGVAKFRKRCLAYDSKLGEFKHPCPYCDLGNNGQVYFLQNFIDREAQRAKPARVAPFTASEKKKHKMGAHEYFFKEMSSESWTPVSVAKITSAPLTSIINITQLNTRTMADGSSAAFGPEHPKHGFDITWKGDKDQAAALRIYIAKERNSKLSPEELDYRIWNLDVEKAESYEQALREAKSIGTRLCVRNDKGEFVDAPRSDTTGGAAAGSGGKPAKGSSKNDYLGDLDEDEDEETSSDAYDDDDDAPVAKAKPKAAKKGLKVKPKAGKAKPGLRF